MWIPAYTWLEVEKIEPIQREMNGSITSFLSQHKGKVIKVADKTGDLSGVPNNTEKRPYSCRTEETIQELSSLKQ